MLYQKNIGLYIFFLNKERNERQRILNFNKNNLFTFFIGQLKRSIDMFK